jgi:hypothetical protein
VGQIRTVYQILIKNHGEKNYFEDLSVDGSGREEYKAVL